MNYDNSKKPVAKVQANIVRCAGVAGATPACRSAADETPSSGTVVNKAAVLRWAAVVSIPLRSASNVSPGGHSRLNISAALKSTCFDKFAFAVY